LAKEQNRNICEIGRIYWGMRVFFKNSENYLAKGPRICYHNPDYMERALKEQSTLAGIIRHLA
jgi:hypothetical protein